MRHVISPKISLLFSRNLEEKFWQVLKHIQRTLNQPGYKIRDTPFVCIAYRHVHQFIMYLANTCLLLVLRGS